MVQGATVLTLDSSELQAAGGEYTLADGGIGSAPYGDFSVTMVLDAQAFQKAILAGNVKAEIFSANPDTTTTIGLGINFISSSSTAGIYGSWAGSTATRQITNDSELNLSTELKELFTGNSYESAAITYQITDTGTRTYLTLVDSEGTATTYSGGDSNLKSQGFGVLTSFTYNTNYVKYLVVDDDTTLQANYYYEEANLNAIAAAAVPEPATASLSLIGLAALMMRRRRA